MRGGLSLTSSASLLSLLGLTSLHHTLRDSANNICLAPDWEVSTLCTWMGVTYPEYPRTQSLLQEFREALNDPARDVWVQAGEGVWRKLLEVGVVYRTSKMGTSIEARREPYHQGSWNCFISVNMGPVLLWEVPKARVGRRKRRGTWLFMCPV